jgi:hypothetical protein
VVNTTNFHTGDATSPQPPQQNLMSQKDQSRRGVRRDAPC